MNGKRIQQLAIGITVLLLWSARIASATAGTAFAYQGRLQDGSAPAQGSYDVRFAVYDAVGGGTQWGPALTNAAVAISNGLFTVTLDFGAGVFDGGPRWLQIGVRTNGSPDDYVALSPRQPISPAPYAIWAASADTVPAGNITSGTIPDARLSTNVALLDQSASFSGTVAASSFQGNGAGLTNVAGTFTWQVVSGTTQQAVSNRGYLANNAATVTITLPSSPAVGEVVRVAGMGVGGWKIAQNDGQVILTRPIGGVAGLAWTPCTNAPSAYWQVLAMSSDGTKVLAGQTGGQLYTSTDAGATWTARETTRYWRWGASSADGTKLVAVVQNGQLYTSTDSGVTWTPRESNRSWVNVASSSDGVKLVAVVQNGQIYTSTDSGITWTPRETNRIWQAVASSADGTKLVAGAWNDQIYTSADSGVTWTARESVRTWRCAASSADGTRLVVAVEGGQIFTSSDSGTNWTAHGSANGYESIACSADATKLAAVVEGGSIYTSTDSGVSWTEFPLQQEWECVGCSADGNRLVAVPGGGLIYSSIPTTTAGTAGALTGDRDAAAELQYVGVGQFRILSFVGSISAQ
jgi:hypothetical protein